MNISIKQAIESNKRAEELLKQGKQNDALVLLRRIFSDFGKCEDKEMQFQVARALHVAATCYRELGKNELAESLMCTLGERYADSTDTRIRNWIDTEKVTGVNDPELDKFLEQLLTTKDVRMQSEEESRPNPKENTAPHSESDVLSMFIPAEEVTTERLQQVFQSAFIDCHFDDDGDLQVEIDETQEFVIVHKKIKIIQFETYWPLRQYADINEKLDFANCINRKFMYVQAAVRNENTLGINCFHAYAYGVLPHQIVHAARLLARIARSAIKECDENNLIG